MGKPAGPPAPRRAPQAGLRCRHLIPAARSHGSKRRSARTGSEVAMGRFSASEASSRDCLGSGGHGAGVMDWGAGGSGRADQH